MTRQRHSLRPYLLGGGLILALVSVVLLYQVFLKDVLSVSALVAAKQSLASFVSTHVIWLFPAAILAYAVATAVLLPTVSWLSIAIAYGFGSAFGVGMGTLVAATAVYLGVLAGLPIAFWVVRGIFGDGLRQRFGPSLDRIAKGVEEEPFFYLLSLRLLPIFPYVLVNVGPALVRVSLKTHWLATALGVLPGVLVYAYLGASLTTAIDPSGLQVSWQILAALAALGSLSLVPIVAKRLLPSSTNRAMDADIQEGSGQ